MSEAQHAPEGQVIEGRYRVVSRIADGGMATVYQAVDERLGRTVAIKIMRTRSWHRAHNATSSWNVSIARPVPQQQ